MPSFNNTTDKTFRSQPRRHLLIASALLVGVPALSLGVWSLGPWWTPQPNEVLHVELDLEMPSIAIDVFWPAADQRAERCPAVLLLHGVEGVALGASDHYSRARQLTGDGYAVFVVHYLEPCGYEHLYLLTEDGAKLDKDQIDAVIRRDHERWHQAVLQTLSHVANRPDIDAQRIGVLGYSLGCFVGISACDAANRDEDVPDIAALVGNWGSRYEHVRCNASFCACRLFHGQEDDIVPVAWPQQFVAELEEAGVDVKLHVFPGEKHVVRNRAAWREAREFFKRKLRAPNLSRTTAPDPSMLAAPAIPASLELRNLCY